MSVFKGRIPPQRELLPVFSLGFVLVYSWSILMFFNYLPGWLMYLNGWTILGIFAYGQVFALFESLVIFLLLILLALLLPGNWLRAHFVPQASLLLLIATAGALLVHSMGDVPLWPSKRLLLGLAGYLGLAVASALLLRRFPRFAGAVERAARRLVILLYLYLPLVLLSGVVVLLRNLGSG